MHIPIPAISVIIPIAYSRFAFYLELGILFQSYLLRQYFYIVKITLLKSPTLEKITVFGWSARASSWLIFRGHILFLKNPPLNTRITLGYGGILPVRVTGIWDLLREQQIKLFLPLSLQSRPGAWFTLFHSFVLLSLDSWIPVK